MMARQLDDSLVLGAEISIYTRSVDGGAWFRRQLTSVLASEGICCSSGDGLVIGVYITFFRRFNGFSMGFLAGFFIELPVGLRVTFLTLVGNSFQGGSLIILLV